MREPKNTNWEYNFRSTGDLQDSGGRERRRLRAEAWRLRGRYNPGARACPSRLLGQERTWRAGRSDAGCDERGAVIGPRWWGSGWAWTRPAATGGRRLASGSAAPRSPPGSAWWEGRRPTPGWAWRQTGSVSQDRTAAAPWWTAFCHTTHTHSQWAIHNNNNNSYIALDPVKIYELAALYIINIKIHLTIKKAQVL